MKKLYQVENFERSLKTCRDSPREDYTTSRKSWKDVFENILDDVLEDSHVVSSQRMEPEKEKHVCFKVATEDDNTEVTSLTYDQIFKLSVKFNRNN